jgi:predicted CoA-substrate-specific enzyme activase
LSKIAVGIDAGSRAIKIVMISAHSHEVIASSIVDQGVRGEQIARKQFEDMLDQNGLKRTDVKEIVATGYGRNAIDFADTTITEITCHARGVYHLLPEARTIVEIGGQDSKVLVLDAKGAVRDFAMNDRCAAGTGRFLEVVADRLDTKLDLLGEIAARSKKPAAISSMCIVFAETEIIGLMSSGTPPEDIVAGVQNSIASRVAALVGSKVVAPVAFTGGVAMVAGMDRALGKALGHDVTIPPQPQLTGALGAALLAAIRRD